MPSRSYVQGSAAAFSCLLQRLRAWRRSVIDTRFYGTRLSAPPRGSGRGIRTPCVHACVRAIVSKCVSREIRALVITRGGFIARRLASREKLTSVPFRAIVPLGVPRARNPSTADTKRANCRSDAREDAVTVISSRKYHRRCVDACPESLVRFIDAFLLFQ